MSPVDTRRVIFERGGVRVTSGLRGIRPTVPPVLPPPPTNGGPGKGQGGGTGAPGQGKGQGGDHGKGLGAGNSLSALALALGAISSTRGVVVTSPSVPAIQQIAYVEVTSVLSVTATTEAGAQTFADSGTLAYTAVPTTIEFYCPWLDAGASGGNTLLNLWDGATNLGIIAVEGNSGTSTQRSPVFVRRYLTPTAANHNYIVKAWRQAVNGNVGCGPGGIANYLPAYIRVTTGS